MEQHRDDHEIATFFSGCSEGRRFTVLNIIGKGSYGVVASALDNLTGQRVAIKRVKNVFGYVPDAARILMEITLLRLLKSQDVVNILHILLPTDPRTFQDLYMVTELFESDLHTVIDANDDLTPDHHKVFLHQLLRGLNFMHQSGILHRDLKPKNILVNSDCTLKICDLGLARPYFPEDHSPTPTFLTTYVATRWYRAPELVGDFYGHYTQAVDVWGIGCIFAEVLLGQALFRGDNAVGQLNAITDILGKPSEEVIERISNRKARMFLHQMPMKRDRLAVTFPGLDPLALDLLKRMLSFDPDERPSCAEALGHPYFQGMPPAAEPATAFGREHFPFERRGLSESDVRDYMYKEVLHYHPNILELYSDGHTEAGIRGLLSMVVEQYGPYLLPAMQASQQQMIRQQQLKDEQQQEEIQEIMQQRQHELLSQHQQMMLQQQQQQQKALAQQQLEIVLQRQQEILLQPQQMVQQQQQEMVQQQLNLMLQHQQQMVLQQQLQQEQGQLQQEA